MRQGHKATKSFKYISTPLPQRFSPGEMDATEGSASETPGTGRPHAMSRQSKELKWRQCFVEFRTPWLFARQGHAMPGGRTTVGNAAKRIGRVQMR